MSGNRDSETAGVPRLSWRPRLGNLKTTRMTMSRLFKEWATGAVSDADYRGGMWGLSQIVGAFRIQAELDIEKRLREIEDRMRGVT